MEPAGQGEVTLRGVARDGKAGALVVTVDGGGIYLAGLGSWPVEVHGREVEAVGRLVTTKLIADPVDAKGEITQGAWGEQTVLEGHRWRVVESE